MKLIGILASPRKNGNVAQMLDCAVEKAKLLGYDIEYVDLHEKSIAYCTGCMSCKKTGICVIKDDVADIRKSLLESDVVVIACPTYFANVTAPLKALFDRLVGAVMDDNNGPIPRPKLSKKQKYVLLTACNTPAPFDRLARQSTGCLKAMDEVMHISGMTRAGRIVFAGTRGKRKPTKAVIQKINRCMERLSI